MASGHEWLQPYYMSGCSLIKRLLPPPAISRAGRAGRRAGPRFRVVRQGKRQGAATRARPPRVEGGANATPRDLDPAPDTAAATTLRADREADHPAGPQLHSADSDGAECAVPVARAGGPSLAGRRPLRAEVPPRASITLRQSPRAR